MDDAPKTSDPTQPEPDETWDAGSSELGSVTRGLNPGTVVAGRYRIDAYVAAGGMGHGSIEKINCRIGQYGNQPHFMHVRWIRLAHDLPLAATAGRHHR